MCRSNRLLHIGLAAALLLAAGSSIAGEVRLRSGMVISGTPRKLQSLTIRYTHGPNSSFNIVLIETGSAWYFVPAKQLAEDGLDLDGGLLKQEIFRIKQEKQQKSPFSPASVGLFSESTPFDKYGRRRVTLPGRKEPIHIMQGITEITPDSVTLTGLTHNWEYGISTKMIPAEELEQVLRHRIDPQNSLLRLQLTRFFIQSEMYPQAFHELDAIARDFPELKDKATSVHQELVQEFGRAVLRELKRRVEAGQYQLAEEYARQVAVDRMGGAVQKDAAELLKAGEVRRETTARARELLDDSLAKLSNETQKSKLSLMRSVVNEELHPDSLGRLDPFLKSATDEGYTVDEKLALAYSGWVLGAANAVTDLDQAIRLWDARFLVQESLRGPTKNERELVYAQLKKVEGVGPETVRKIIPQLPPVVETPDIEPGKPHRIELPGTDDTPDVSYAALLPPEYSPQHAYPLVISLRAQGRTPEQMLAWWGGSAEEPGLSQRRGYIVISPEFAAADKGEYGYDAATHERVLRAMNDARRRFNIDSDRIFLSGHGMGADAAFDIGFTHFDEFAGVIPICGACDQYAKRYIPNAVGSAWYIVNGELDRSLTQQNHPVIDQLMKQFGFKIDSIYCEFPQRGFEHYAEELPRIFDWMAVHRRLPLPPHVDVSSLRQSDCKFFWVEANDLPHTVLLDAPRGSKGNTAPMQIDVRIGAGNTTRTVISVNSPSPRHTLWIHPDLVNLEQRVLIKIRSQQKYNDFIESNAAATLEDYFTRGDRQRLYAAKLEF